MLAGTQGWLFLADDSCTSGQDDLLAMQTQAGTAQMATQGELAVVLARDLELTAPDVPQVGLDSCVTLVSALALSSTEVRHAEPAAGPDAARLQHHHGLCRQAPW